MSIVDAVFQRNVRLTLS